jgi:hypothetical protein
MTTAREQNGEMQTCKRMRTRVNDFVNEVTLSLFFFSFF